MENPFLREKRKNYILKRNISIGVVILILATISFTGVVSDIMKQVSNYKENQQLKEQKIQELKLELQKKNEELKKVSAVRSVIKNQIIASGVKPNTAEKYANAIIKESVSRGHSPIIQTALIQSESSFNNSVKHDISNVIGLGGVYWDVWKVDLKKNNIAYSKEQLRNPYVNIKASSYILSKYMKMSNTPREALARYKGYSALGKSQANDVMKIALNLKRKVGNERVI